MTETPEQQLRQKMLKALAHACQFKGISFRNVGQRFANKQDIVSTRGSYKLGGRYNVAQGLGVLYLSCDLDTCIKELEHAARREGVEVEEKMPRTVTGIKVRLTKVLNLTDPKVRRELGVSRRTLVETDWTAENKDGREALTQIIGRLAKDAGFDALWVPSARSSGQNINLLDHGNLSLPRVKVINIQKLGTKKGATSRRRRSE